MSLHTSVANDNELAELAYGAVKHIPTIEPNDRNRLGYHVWLFLRGEISTLDGAVRQARSRFSPRTLPIEDVVMHIEAELRALHTPKMSVGESGLQ